MAEDLICMTSMFTAESERCDAFLFEPYLINKGPFQSLFNAVVKTVYIFMLFVGDLLYKRTRKCGA